MKKTTKVKTNSQKGFTLVEVVAALGISALVITALISLSISTLRISLDSKLLLEGTKIANREAELIRAYRDRIDVNWEGFIDHVRACTPTNPCHIGTSGAPDNGKGSQGTGAEKVEWFFTVTSVDNGEQIPPGNYPSIVRISVSATWKVGDEQKGSYIYTDLSNWRMK